MSLLGRADARNRLELIKSSFYLSEAFAIFESEAVRQRIMDFLESMTIEPTEDVTRERTDNISKNFILAISAMLEELGIKSLKATAARSDG